MTRPHRIVSVTTTGRRYVASYSTLAAAKSARAEELRRRPDRILDIVCGDAVIVHHYDDPTPEVTP
jgi:hypothetical protein